MEITLEMVDQVRERTGVSYEQAKAALEAANGNVVDAIISIEHTDEPAGIELGEKIKEAIKKGNVTKLRVSRDGKVLATIPLTAGAAVGALGMIFAPFAVGATVVAGVVGKYGFNCKYELIKEDGSVEEISATAFEKKAEEPCETCEEKKPDDQAE